MPWSRAFEDPIPLPSGKPLMTLRQAGEYISKLPAKTQKQPHWQLATEMLLHAADGKIPLLMASIAMLKTRNHSIG